MGQGFMLASKERRNYYKISVNVYFRDGPRKVHPNTQDSIPEEVHVPTMHL